MTATDTFHSRLNVLIDAGEELPCWDRSHGNPWLSDKADEREYAANQCGRCPLLEECLAMALHEGVSFGVFGALDFAQRPGRKRTPPKSRARPPAKQEPTLDPANDTGQAGG